MKWAALFSTLKLLISKRCLQNKLGFSNLHFHKNPVSTNYSSQTSLQTHPENRKPLFSKTDRSRITGILKLSIIWFLVRVTLANLIRRDQRPRRMTKELCNTAMFRDSLRKAETHLPRNGNLFLVQTVRHKLRVHADREHHPLALNVFRVRLELRRKFPRAVSRCLINISFM